MLLWQCEHFASVVFFNVFSIQALITGKRNSTLGKNVLYQCSPQTAFAGCRTWHLKSTAGFKRQKFHGAKISHFTVLYVPLFQTEQDGDWVGQSEAGPSESEQPADGNHPTEGGAVTAARPMAGKDLTPPPHGHGGPRFWPPLHTTVGDGGSDRPSTWPWGTGRIWPPLHTRGSGRNTRCSTLPLYSVTSLNQLLSNPDNSIAE